MSYLSLLKPEADQKSEMHYRVRYLTLPLRKLYEHQVQKREAQNTTNQCKYLPMPMILILSGDQRGVLKFRKNCRRGGSTGKYMKITRPTNHYVFKMKNYEFVCERV